MDKLTLINMVNKTANDANRASELAHEYKQRLDSAIASNHEYTISFQIDYENSLLKEAEAWNTYKHYQKMLNDYEG